VKIVILTLYKIVNTSVTFHVLAFITIYVCLVQKKKNMNKIKNLSCGSFLNLVDLTRNDPYYILITCNLKSNLTEYLENCVNVAIEQF